MYPKPDKTWALEANDIRSADLKKYPLFAGDNTRHDRRWPRRNAVYPLRMAACGSPTPATSVALGSLNASNWENFMQEVDSNMNQRRPQITKVVQAYLSALGMFEKVGMSV